MYERIDGRALTRLDGLHEDRSIEFHYSYRDV